LMCLNGRFAHDDTSIFITIRMDLFLVMCREVDSF